MSELSQDEKARIRAELEYRYAVTQELHPHSKVWKRLSESLSHPIIITVIGGMLVAAVGAYLQNGYAVKQAEALHLRQIQEKKISIVAISPAHIYKDMALIVNRSYLRLDLEAWKSNPKHKAYLGRTRREVLALYDKLADEYIKTPRSAPLLSEVKSWFCDKTVSEQADKLDDQMESFVKLRASKLTEENIEEFGDGIRKKLNSLVAAMVTEVKNPPLKCT